MFDCVTLARSLKDFIEAFRRNGVTLAIFFDGNPAPAKLVTFRLGGLSQKYSNSIQETLVERREQTIEACKHLFDNLSSPVLHLEAQRKYLPFLVLVPPRTPFSCGI